MQRNWAFLFLLLSGCSYWKQPKAGLQSSFAGNIYVVQKGDTIHSIAQRTRVSAIDLMEVNGIVDSGKLGVGRRLYIPEPELALSQPASKKVAAVAYKAPKAIPDGKKIDLIWPVKNGVLFKTFDSNPQRLYEGIALGAPKGTAVMAAAAGEVVYVGDDEARYGRIVIINHEEPFVTIYAHLDQVDVAKGHKVKQRELVGTVGQSGGVDSPRVYFQVRKHRTPVDPELYLKN